ncbi:hypothetical protein [Aeromicrobium sp. UC242_57]
MTPGSGGDSSRSARAPTQAPTPLETYGLPQMIEPQSTTSEYWIDPS